MRRNKADNSVHSATVAYISEGMKIRSEYLPFRTRVLYRPRQNDRLRVMFSTSLYRYHTVTYPHASDSVNRRTNDTIFVASIQVMDVSHLEVCSALKSLDYIVKKYWSMNGLEGQWPGIR
ncbi:hypothetical protein TNCV_671451 [Trichonephila clavipes]|nr:hypothetical protein TNCV_671451 [Trichonephila clavipes]